MRLCMSHFSVSTCYQLQTHRQRGTERDRDKLMYTVPVPIKDVASIQKLFFQSTIMVRFCKILSFFAIFDGTKFNKNTPIFGKFLSAATIQERPLLAWVR